MAKPINQHKITIKALWLDPNVGLEGYIGAILFDGTPVALCSNEKWRLGRRDSLRSGWTKDSRNVSVRHGVKVFYNQYSAQALRKDGLLNLTVPVSLRKLTKRA
jgi:hypothetical protein